MADQKYKPLRVPIGLLHQRAYTTSRRLEPIKHMVDAELKPLTQRRMGIGGPVSVPVYPGFGARRDEVFTVMRNVFDVSAYLRKYWVLLDGISKTACRGCGEFADTPRERNEHYECNKDIHFVINELIKQEVCVICEGSLKNAPVVMNFYGCPVCSDECLDIWDVMVPNAFERLYDNLIKTGHTNG